MNAHWLSTSDGSLDWTHTGIKIEDIRIFNKLYAIYITDNEGIINTPLFVSKNIFDERLYSYFLTAAYTREDILNIRWNMYITKGYYVKIDNGGNINNIQGIEDKWYISYLDVCGMLGDFSFVYKYDNVKK